MKKGENEEKRRGFTIIEVSLVLAIAGLIMLMVFIALPQVLRGQRDAERREDASTLLGAIKKYQSNNRGALPAYSEGRIITVSNTFNSLTAWGQFYSDYLGADFVDPSGGNYFLEVTACDRNSSLGAGANCWDNGATNIGTIKVIAGASCDGNNAVKTNNPRKVAVLIRLESGDTTYCDNS